MKTMHNFAYIALGGVLMLIGVIASSVLMPSLVAQRGGDIITCSELRLLNAAGNEVGRLFTTPEGSGAFRLTDKNARLTSNGVFLSRDKGIALGPEMLTLSDAGKMAISLSTIATAVEGVSMRGLKILKDDGRNSACYLIGDATGGQLGVLTGGKLYMFPDLETVLSDILNTK